MNILIVHAHPEPKSLNGALKDFAVQRLEAAGHTVQVSDLYAMRWKAIVDADDSTAAPIGPHFHPSLDSRHAFQNGLQAADIAAEQAKLEAILQASGSYPFHLAPDLFADPGLLSE